MTVAIPKSYDLYVGNTSRPAVASARMDTVSPLTGEVLTTVPDAGARICLATTKARPRGNNFDSETVRTQWIFTEVLASTPLTVASRATDSEADGT